MKGTMAQVRHVALLAEPVAKPGRREWRAKFADQKRQVFITCGVDYGPQIGMNWNGQLNSCGALGLSARPAQHPVSNVLRSHRDYILARLPRVKPQRQRQPWLCAYRVPRLELRYLPFAPSMNRV